MAKLVLALLLVVAGCVSNPRNSETACSGSRYVVVSNYWTRAVDVYMYSRGGSPTLIGAVTPSSRGEFMLPESGAYASVRPEGATTNVGMPYDVVGKQVVLSYSCR